VRELGYIRNIDSLEQGHRFIESYVMRRESKKERERERMR
jgi:hypothetical protein